MLLYNVQGSKRQRLEPDFLTMDCTICLQNPDLFPLVVGFLLVPEVYSLLACQKRWQTPLLSAKSEAHVLAKCIVASSP